jgi:hypothetical protein
MLTTAADDDKPLTPALQEDLPHSALLWYADTGWYGIRYSTIHLKPGDTCLMLLPLPLLVLVIGDCHCCCFKYYVNVLGLYYDVLIFFASNISNADETYFDITAEIEETLCT